MGWSQTFQFERRLGYKEDNIVLRPTLKFLVRFSQGQAVLCEGKDLALSLHSTLWSAHLQIF